MVVDMLAEASAGATGGSRGGFALAGGMDDVSRTGGLAPVCLVGRGGCMGRSGWRTG